jgi:hypothetical protein
MASITINEVSKPILPFTTITGDEKLVSIGKDGKPSTVSVNQIIDKMDDSIVDRVEEQILVSVDNQIEERVEYIIERTASINKEDVDNIFNS